MPGFSTLPRFLCQYFGYFITSISSLLFPNLTVVVFQRFVQKLIIQNFKYKIQFNLNSERIPFSSEAIVCFTDKDGEWGAPRQHRGGGVGSEPALAEAQGRLSAGQGCGEHCLPHVTPGLHQMMPLGPPRCPIVWFPYDKAF